MSRDLSCNETMPAVDETERKDNRRFFQQPISLPIARITPVMPNITAQQNSRQLFRTYIRSQVTAQIQAGCSSGTHKALHTHGTTIASPAAQLNQPAPGRSKIFTLRPAPNVHPLLKSYDIAQFTGGPMATVYVQQQQQQQNLHIMNTQQPTICLSPSRAREAEEVRSLRSPPTSFVNSGVLDARRLLTAGRGLVGVSDMPFRGSLRFNPLCSTADLIRGVKTTPENTLKTTFTTRIPDEKGDMQPTRISVPTVNLSGSINATMNALPDICSSTNSEHSDGVNTSHPGPSARPTILRKNREPGSSSAVRRLIVTEDESGAMSTRRTASGEGRLLSAIPFSSSDVRASSGFFGKKNPALAVSNVAPNKKSCTDQSTDIGAPEISPRKRLRKQNFDCTSSEKMKLLMTSDQSIGDPVVNMNDEHTRKCGNADSGGGSDWIRKLQKRMAELKRLSGLDNGALGEYAQQQSSSVSSQVNVGDGHTKIKRVRRTQAMYSQDDSTSETRSFVQSESSASFGSSHVDEKQSWSYRMFGRHIDPSEYDTKEKSDALGKSLGLWNAYPLLCHVFGIDTSARNEQSIANKQIAPNKADEPIVTVSSHGEKNDHKSDAIAVHKGEMITERTVESTSGASLGLKHPKSTHDSILSVAEYCQLMSKVLKILIRVLRCCEVKNRGERLISLSGCERILKLAYMKHRMLRRHLRSLSREQTASVDTNGVELDSNMVAMFDDFSSLAAKKQTKNFLETYPACTPSTSDSIFKENVRNDAADLKNCLERALEILLRSAGICSINPRSLRISDLTYSDSASRCDSEKELLLAVAELLAEMIESVVKNDEEKHAEENSYYSQQRRSRRKKRRNQEWPEVEIPERFGTSMLPLTLSQPSNSSSSLYDDVSQFTITRKKTDPLDPDSAVFMKLEKELRKKKKQIGADRNLSRELRAVSRVRTVHQRLSDTRMAERDNMNRAVELAVEHVKCTDTQTYNQLLKEHEEECLPYDDEKAREEKWRKRTALFIKTAPCIVPSPENYDPNNSIRTNVSMSEVMKLFKGKYPMSKHLRTRLKRLRKSHTRNKGRGRQRVYMVHPKKKPSTPEPRLEDLEPRFSATEMSRMFREEFGTDIEALRYERYKQMERKDSQEQSVDKDAQAESQKSMLASSSDQNKHSMDCCNSEEVKERGENELEVASEMRDGGENESCAAVEEMGGEGENKSKTALEEMDESGQSKSKTASEIMEDGGENKSETALEEMKEGELSNSETAFEEMKEGEENKPDTVLEEKEGGGCKSEAASNEMEEGGGSKSETVLEIKEEGESRSEAESEVKTGIKNGSDEVDIETAVLDSVEEVAPEMLEEEVAPGMPEEEVASKMLEGEVAPEMPEGEIAPEMPKGEVAPEVAEREVDSEILEREVVSELAEKEIAAEMTDREVDSGMPEREVVPEMTDKEVDSGMPEREVAPEMLEIEVLQISEKELDSEMLENTVDDEERNTLSLEGHDSSGSHFGSSDTIPYVDRNVNTEDDLLKHIHARGQSVREDFATLRCGQQINDLLVTKAIRMFKDHTLELFKRDNKDNTKSH